MENVSFFSMDRNTKKEYDAILVRILRKIKEICDENGIKWFLAYGSCLGAVRHKGIIPWDDDVDICMSRPDFDRFVDICRHKNLEGFELCTSESTEGFYDHWARFVDKNTTLLWNIERPFVSGIYVDVFPLDGAADGNILGNYKRYIFWSRVTNFARTNYSCKQFMDWLLHGKLQYFLLALGTTIFRNYCLKLGVRKKSTIVRKYDYHESTFTTLYINVYKHKKNIIKKSWIEDTIMVPFEDMLAPIPKGYDAYLTHLYGDYMTPPPDNQKDDRHIVKFIDLNERLTLEEIKNRLKGE